MNEPIDPHYRDALAGLGEPLVTERVAWRNGHDAGAKRELNVYTSDTLARTEPKPREWYVPGLIPMRCVTLLYGNGGDGKSLLALQLAIAGVTATDWLGELPEPGGVLMLSAEDDIDEIQRRQADIIRGRGDIDIDSLRNLRIVDLAGQDALLAVPDRSKSKLETTPLFAQIEDLVKLHRPRLLVVDTLADVFGGSEIDRAQVRQFIGFLNALAIRHDMAVVVLAHPSVAGMASGTGTSGSTGWSNSVRSRLYLAPPKGEEGSTPDPALKTLEVRKSNYGPIGTTILLRWSNGRFVLAGTGSAARMTSAEIDQLFLDLLAQFAREGRNVSPNKGPSYAPAEFASHADAHGVKGLAFKASQDRLLKAGTIEIVEFGPPSRRRSRLEIAPSEPDDNG